MTQLYQQANARLQQCLALSDQAIKNHAQQQDSDQALNELDQLAKSIPADASAAHAQLFDHFSQGQFRLATSRSDLQLALNPAHRKPDHWDSSHSIPELCDGMIHGGILTLQNTHQPRKLLLFGGCIHVNYGIYKRKGKLLDRCSGIGLTVMPLTPNSPPLVHTEFDNKYLNTYAFGKTGANSLIKTIRSAKQHPFCGHLSAREGKQYFMFRHLLRSVEVNRCYAAIKGSAHSVIPPFNMKGSNTLFRRYDPNHPRLRDANHPRNQFSDRFSHPQTDPFSPWFLPTMQDNRLLHQSAYLRVIHPDPTRGPAIITYIAGQRLIRHQSRRSNQNRWQLVANQSSWSTRMAIVE